jgi:hypothetical protein
MRLGGGGVRGREVFGLGWGLSDVKSMIRIDVGFVPLLSLDSVYIVSNESDSGPVSLRVGGFFEAS